MKFLILKITNNCNLRCIYCYRENNSSKKDMEFKTAKNAIDYILKSDDRLKIQFTGGEPLLNFKLIEKVVNYCNDQYPDKNISYAIQTNGTLLEEGTIERIKELDIKVGVSLDTIDPRDATLRPYKNGKPSTLDTLKGIYLLRKKNVPFGITTVVTSKNLPHLLDLVYYLISIGVRSISFDLLKPKKREHLSLMPMEGEFRKILEEMKDLPIYIKNLRRNSQDKYCYLNSGDLLFVNEIGDIYPCPTLEGCFYGGNINSGEGIKLFKVKCNYCFARSYLMKVVNDPS